ncbi:MAG: CGNR zinc finger domain-containing protein [Actinobacteria bacterium]|nr:CGNR zinc finger domain-containing protein [Actinomycetota bacterium]MCG2801694.1 CGNR zinc finger domain-containing protein [Cellulomonas sp.]
MDAHGLVVDLLNTLDVEAGTDLLDDAGTWATWCAEHQVATGNRMQARLVRTRLRAVVAGATWSGPAGWTVPVTVGPEGVVVHGRSAVEAVLAAAVQLTVTGDWRRLKLCPADDCRHAFYDRSRNRTRIWCEMSDCGNRAKVRRYRARHPLSAAPRRLHTNGRSGAGADQVVTGT